MHTKESSWCGQVPGARAAELYAQAGYDGLCVTDHYFREALEILPARSLTERIRLWMAGYHAVRAEGEKLGMKVLLGMELRFDNSFNDYLVYGLTEEFLNKHPELYAMKPSAFHRLAQRHKLLFVQAHPYRSVCTPANPSSLDGLEVFNGHRRHNSRNDRAVAMADDHPHLIRLAGSDFHQEEDVAGAAMLFESRLSDSPSIAAALRDGQSKGLRTGTWAKPQTIWA